MSGFFLAAILWHDLTLQKITSILSYIKRNVKNESCKASLKAVDISCAGPPVRSLARSLARRDAGGGGKLRSIPSVVETIRKWHQGNSADSVSSGQFHTRQLVRVYFHYGLTDLPATMSVLCYNKGCGQRFDPENNPDGK